MDPLSARGETLRLTQRGVLVCAGTSVSLGVLALAGWLLPWRGWASLTSSSIPMAPVTALSLCLLGIAVLLEALTPSLPRTAAAASLALIPPAVTLVLSLAGLPAWPDSLIVPEPEQVHGVPVARMSPLTAAALLLASLGLLSAGRARHRARGWPAAAALASLVCLIGVVVALGYGFGTPLLYGGPLVPMALPTALGTVSLGMALVGLVPPDQLPLRLLRGPSAKARLLRAFLPIAPAVVIVDFLLWRAGGMNPALQSAVEGLASGVVIAGIVFFAAHAVSRDLDRAEAERNRARSDVDRLAAIVQSSSDAIWARDRRGTILSWNRAAERIFGHSAEEVVGREAAILLPPGAAGEPEQILERLERGERVDHVEAKRMRKDGSTALVSLSASLLRDAAGQTVAVSTIARDVTEQRRTEGLLLESERKLRALVESDAVGILFGDVHGSIHDCNDKLLAMLGYTRADLEAGLRWTDITPPEFLPLDVERVAEARARGACTPYEKQYVRKDGTRFWILVGYVLLEPERERSVAFIVDVDARKRAEGALRRSEERFAKVFDSRLAAIGIAERESGRLIDVNQRCAEFFGYRRDEMIGRTVFELRLWADAADRERLMVRLPGRAAHGEVRFRLKSGEIRHAMVSMEAVTLSDVPLPLTMVAIVDLTERRHLEAQLLQAQKIEAVGRLAGGVAHDFNNLLGVILGYGELLLRTASDAQRKRLDQLLRAAERGAGLTRQLLAFSRRQIVDPKVVDLNVLLADLEKMLGRLIGEDVELTIVTGEDLGQVRADPGQIEQVVMNLCVNARDAMPGGGRLCIETANAELDAAYAAGHEPMPRGRYVRLAVTDTGCGIPRELLDKIFEPFFTTKEAGKGTGLGLSTVYGIVKQAGGYVWVYSEPGQGTSFKIYLPRIDEPVTATRSMPLESPPGGSETILLVEDEAALRMTTREILEEKGYRLLEAGSGPEALELVAREPAPIDLLLTDVVMPGMDGRTLAEAVRARHPETRILYMSGYTDDVISKRGVLEPGTLLLEKPFNAATLLRRVREAVGVGRGRRGA